MSHPNRPLGFHPCGSTGGSPRFIGLRTNPTKSSGSSRKSWSSSRQAPPPLSPCVFASFYFFLTNQPCAKFFQPKLTVMFLLLSGFLLETQPPPQRAGPLLETNPYAQTARPPCSGPRSSSPRRARPCGCSGRRRRGRSA